MPDYILHPKQAKAVFSKADEVLYGGAAGGGKSYALRIRAVLASLMAPGCQSFLFRRNYQDLIDNHFRGHQNFYDLLAPYFEKKLVNHDKGAKEIRFWNGSSILYRHADTYEDLMKSSQGAQIHQLLIDEGTQFTGEMYSWLRSRNRLGGWRPPEDCKIPFPSIMVGANPGGIGHGYFKSNFIDSAEPMEVWEVDGRKRQYVPARLEDNPTMTETDPNYESNLLSMANTEVAKAMRYGDWDIVAGAAFEKLSKRTHSLRPFTPPNHWTRFMAIDWGTAKPYSVLWLAVAEGHTTLAAKDGYEAREIPDGAVIVYRELYGYGGQPDKGTREESFEVARKILEIEDGEKIDYRVGDAAMWSQHDGPSVAERMWKEGVALIQSKKDRIAGYNECRARIAGDELPMLYITENCLHFWRTVPSLILDSRQPEKGPDTAQEDHVFDCLAYALMSRPYITTKTDRQRRHNQLVIRESRKLSKSTTDPYRTR